jgi:tetratricopeptide (TPR) repeat protein
MIVFALALALCLGPLHEGKHEQIDAATAAIEAAPTQVTLRLARAEIYLQHKELQACADDLDIALTMAPEDRSIVWMRARLSFAQQDFDSALEQTDLFLSTKAEAPQHRAALVLRAQCLTALSKKELAIAAWTFAIKENDRVLPDWYLERAALQDSLADAIQGLDQGIKHLGPVVSLLLRAAEYEEQAGRTDAAIARIQKLADQSQRKETWLKMQGEILLRANQRKFAEKKFQQARDAWTQLSDKRRNTPSMQRLLLQIEQGLKDCEQNLTESERSLAGERHE